MKVYRQPPKAKSIQAKNLDNNILQTQTVRSLISLLRRTGEITKNHTNHEKAINKEIEFVIECHEKHSAELGQEGKCPSFQIIILQEFIKSIYEMSRM